MIRFARGLPSRAVLLLAIAGASVSGAVTFRAEQRNATTESRFQALRWRSIGPYRGGRVTAVAGVPGQPNVYYFGATGGGVWKTDDAGVSWLPVSDGYFKTGSVGGIAVAPSAPDIVYAGMGEACVRSNFSEGDGVYKSTDAGRSWTSIGLTETKQIGRIAVHPANSDVVFVAALGNVFGPSRERGVFRSKDGGKTWRNVLFVNDETGAADVSIDPHAPDTVYATFWHVTRKPWGLFSGGPGSGLYRSSDGGDTWKELTGGLPAGIKGRIGVAVSPVDGKRVWAIVEAHDGGVFRSDDAGSSWIRTNDEARLRERAWYYSHIFADTKERDTVYVLALQVYKSSDGGKTFETIRPRHADNHDLWIAPDDNRRMINGNDGGANISVNSGRTWSSQDNQATAQFYRVTTDTQFPYVIYGAQQDNSTVAIPSRTIGAGIDRTDWHAVGGGESGWIAPDLRDPNVVYAGSYYGLLTRYDHRTGHTRNISVWPESPGGRPAKDVKYRFQWSFPILMSPHDQGTLYAAANVLFKSTSEGQAWAPISPDLTRNDKATQGPVGGEITGDNSSADYYGTIFTVAESPRAKGTLWTGSDDGLIYVTVDGGVNWTNVTPPDLPEFSRINSIEASPHDATTAYAAVTRYQSNDRRPYVYRTSDLGKSWTSLGAGIAADHFVRVVREDPVRRGLLFAGTERGVYVSFDTGASWQSLQLNLPAVPITDLAVRNVDLVASTQGRSFWILDDISPLRQWNAETESIPATLFEPSLVYRQRQQEFGGEAAPGQAARGLNPAPGAHIYFYLRQRPLAPVALTLHDSAGSQIKRFTLEPDGSSTGSGGSRPGTPSAAREGLNRFLWDLRYPDAAPQPAKTLLFGASLRGPIAPPGRYTVSLAVDGRTLRQALDIRVDPRLSTTDTDLKQQFDFLIRVRDRVTAVHETANRILAIQPQLREVADASPTGAGDMAAEARAIERELGSILASLVQMKIQSGNDVLSYPIGLANRIATVGTAVSGADTRPTDQAQAAFDDLSAAIDTELARLTAVLGSRLTTLNKQLTAAGRRPVETGGRQP